MSVVKIPDAAGETITLVEYEGHYLPNAPVEVAKGIRDVTIRDDDIFICAYPKCGTHWVWEMSRLLLARTAEEESERREKDEIMLEFTPNEKLKTFPSPRIMNCHLLPKHLPRGVVEKKVKIVYLLRNPKDMAVSFYHHTKKLSKQYQYNGTWDNYLSLLMVGKVESGSYFTYLKCWNALMTEHPELPTLTLVYEDLKEDSLQGIKKLAKFLGVERSEEFYKKVQDLTSFNSMRTAKGHMIKSEDGQPVMYRKGEVGDWKNTFTVAQNEKFDQLINKEMADIDINFRYTLDSTSPCTS